MQAHQEAVAFLHAENELLSLRGTLLGSVPNPLEPGQHVTGLQAIRFGDPLSQRRTDKACNINPVFRKDS